MLKLIICLPALLLLLSGCVQHQAEIPAPDISPSTMSPEPAPTTVPAPLPSTLTPEPGAPSAPTPTPSPSPTPEFIFKDDFSNISSGWPTRSSQIERYECGYQIDNQQSGYYILLKQGQSGTNVLNDAIGEFADFTAAVDCTLGMGQTDGTYGLNFRASRDNLNRYVFVVSTNGRYFIEKWVNGQSSTLINWTDSPYIKRGGNQVNRVMVQCIGSAISTFVNGQLLTTITDSTHQKGFIGLIARPSQANTLFKYYDFSLGLPSGQPDLAWAGTPIFEPLAPTVGDKFHAKLSWINTGGAISSDIRVKLEIRQADLRVFEEDIKISRPIKRLEEYILDITPEYMIPGPGSYQLVLTLDSDQAVSESNEDNNVIQSKEMDVPDLSKEPILSKGTDMAALAQAEKDIEKYRKGDMTITVVGPDGQSRSGLEVSYVQTTHAFLFGTVISIKDETMWRLMKEAGLNYSVIHFSWKSTEPQPGVFSFGKGQTDLLTKFGFTGIGKVLIFLLKNMTWSTPDYIMKLSFEEYQKSIYPHIHKVVSNYKQEIDVWEVLNEPMNSLPMVMTLTEKQTIDLIRESVRAVRDADPEGKTLINIGAPFGEQATINGYDFLKDAIGAGVDFDEIGLEFYYNGYTNEGLHSLFPRSLTSMAELVDKYSNLGKKIQVTELTVPSASTGNMIGYWGQLWSEELQAEYLKAAYTLFFSKPMVEAIVWHDSTDANPFIYHGGLLNEQNQPKKSYHALKQLIKSWAISGAAVTDEKGRVNFRGFGGNYSVTITDPKTGISKKQEVKVEEQKTSSITITID